MLSWATWPTPLFLAIDRKSEVPTGGESPLWRLDVRALGYTPWHVRENEIQASFSIGQLNFLSQNRLVITFISRTAPGALLRRNRPDLSNLQLNALFVNSQTGEIRTKLEWPITSERARVTAVPGGRFLLIRPDTLTLYSSEVQPLKEVALPVGREGLATWWDAKPSPGGGYLLIWYDTLDGRDRRFELVNVQTMEVARSWTDPGSGGMHVFAPLDDGNVLAINGRGGGLVIGLPDSAWRPVRIDWDPGCRPALYYRPVNNQTILGIGSVALDTCCFSIGLRTGQLLLAQELAHDEFVGSVSVSTGGQRFAIVIDKVHGASRLLDIGGHADVERIMVYDLSSRRWVFTLRGKNRGIRSISELALSPDSSQLALINQDGMLEVYRLPETRGSATQ